MHCSLAVGLAGSLFSYDFGFIIDNNTEYWSKEGEGFLQEDTGHLWFSTYLGESWLFNASLEGHSALIVLHSMPMLKPSL
jgi:hypothetical protein